MTNIKMLEPNSEEKLLRKIFDKVGVNKPSCHVELMGNYYYRIIFSHDFAKRFWGENDREGVIADYQLMEDYTVLGGIRKGIVLTMWQYHLQQMVLKEEPLKYLEKFLK